MNSDRHTENIIKRSPSESRANSDHTGLDVWNEAVFESRRGGSSQALIFRHGLRAEAANDSFAIASRVGLDRLWPNDIVRPAGARFETERIVDVRPGRVVEQTLERRQVSGPRPFAHERRIERIEGDHRDAWIDADTPNHVCDLQERALTPDGIQFL